MASPQMHSVANSASTLRLWIPTSHLTSALSGLVYSSDTDFYGSDVLTITANDLGNSGMCYTDATTVGSACYLIAEYRLPILISAKEDEVDIDSPYEGNLHM